MPSIELSDFLNEDRSMEISDSPRSDDGFHDSTRSSNHPLLDYGKDEIVTSPPSPVSSLHESKYMKAGSEDTSSVREQPVEIAHAKWYRGWGTISLMVGFFLLALAIAVGQYALYSWLNGKAASNINETVDTTFCFLSKHCTTGPYTSQQYITTASVVISNCFQWSLQLALAVASTQYLWKILRTEALRIATIEALFGLRTNPFRIFSLAVIRHAWVLALMAILIYGIPLAASFPPGSLTVKSVYPNITGFAMVPTFNASDPGNGTFVDFNDIAFASFITDKFYTSDDASDSTWNMTISTSFPFVPGQLQQLAITVGMSGEPLPILSPCGPNCTYTYELEGPSLKCSEETRNFTRQGFDPYISQEIYSASWYYFDINLESRTQISPSENSDQIALNVSTVNIPQIPYQNPELNDGNANILMTETKLSCIPFRSTYSITNSYTNDMQTLNYSVIEIEPLPHVNWHEVNISGTIGGNVPEETFGDGLGGLQWNNESLSWFRDSQLLGLVGGLAASINGTCTSQQQNTGNFLRALPLNGDPSAFVYWSSLSLESSGTGAHLMPYTRFSNSFQDYTFPINTVLDPPINFTVTEESLNKLLGDYVVSLIPAFGAWNQSNPVTRSPSHNIYWFSSKKQLLLPYGICLLLALVVIALGMQALHENGVPAADGGFIQLLTTTTGSARLRKAAAANCLGGDGGNMPEEFKKLKIKYGELVDMQVEVGGHVVRRAGFGVDDEVIPLLKGEKYGVVGGI